jgi:hypothetical protein
LNRGALIARSRRIRFEDKADRLQGRRYTVKALILGKVAVAAYIRGVRSNGDMEGG